MKYVLTILMTGLCLAQFPNTFLGEVQVGSDPADVCFSPQGDRAYVAVGWGFAAVVDIEGYSTFSLAGLVSIDGEPAAVQCDGSGGRLYLADGENSAVHVIDTASLTIEKSMDIQPAPMDMVLSQQEKRIYIAHQNGMITVIDTETAEIDGFFWAGNAISSLGVTSDGATVYASDNGSPLESAITAETGGVTRFTSGMDSRCCALNGDGSTLILSSTDWNMLLPVDTETFQPGDQVPAQGEAPVRMVCLPWLPYLYGVNGDDGSVEVYSTQDLTHQGTVQVTGAPSNLAVHPDGERICFVCSGSSRIKIYGFDPAGTGTQSCTGLLSVASSPSLTPSVSITGPENGGVVFQCRDLAGRVLIDETVTVSPGETVQRTLDGLPAGVYMLTARGGGITESAAVVVLQP